VSELTVPQIAQRVKRKPEAIRRWIREGRLPARKIGTQHLVDERELARVLDEASGQLPLPPAWQRTASGAPMPNVVEAVRRSRASH
jgi:excisionase family DNA binding protein